LELLGDSLRRTRQEIPTYATDALPVPSASLSSNRSLGVHRLLIDESCLAQPGASGFLQECERGGIKVEKLNSFRERTFGKLDLGSYLVDELALNQTHPLARLNAAARRARDIALAGCALMLVLSLMVIIAIAIKCDSSGPVFFSRSGSAKTADALRL
jgi:hypothetical protein